MDFYEFCEETGMDYEAPESRQAWECFMQETQGAGPLAFAGWWAENQGRFV